MITTIIICVLEYVSLYDISLRDDLRDDDKNLLGVSNLSPRWANPPDGPKNAADVFHKTDTCNEHPSIIRCIKVCMSFDHDTVPIRSHENCKIEFRWNDLKDDFDLIHICPENNAEGCFEIRDRGRRDIIAEVTAWDTPEHQYDKLHCTAGNQLERHYKHITDEELLMIWRIDLASKGKQEMFNDWIERWRAEARQGNRASKSKGQTS